MTRGLLISGSLFPGEKAVYSRHDALAPSFYKFASTLGHVGHP
ncbi:hypothetical protein HMPREF1981_01634 [Bacteroides pyogenes F0041]|uniref:Uncharacterized protein n=1 Tax=Bacteroides pyogenes F0041 TaxID=1321819 RepID=U2DUY3_9BACE|nr:hypothetical protein HMPREF1981_01634 [Bacteroides pyogenes F0041]